MRRSPAAYCYALLPLDLHVLSLPLAFILSQDQTLHCKNCLFFQPLTRLRRAPRPAGSPTHAISCFQNFKVLLLSPETPLRDAPFLSKAGAKIRPFFKLAKFFFAKIYRQKRTALCATRLHHETFFQNNDSLSQTRPAKQEKTTGIFKK